MTILFKLMEILYFFKTKNPSLFYLAALILWVHDSRLACTVYSAFKCISHRNTLNLEKKTSFKKVM